MNGKTRKQRGRGLANFFRKKNPLSSSTANNRSVTVNKKNNTLAYTRKGSMNTFINIKRRKAITAKAIRTHLQQLRALSPEVRNDAFALMNDASRTRTQRLIDYRNANSLNDEELLELYATGKVRSRSQ